MVASIRAPFKTECARVMVLRVQLTALRSSRVQLTALAQSSPGDKACWLFAMAHDRATNNGIKRNLFPGGHRDPVIQK